MVYQGVIERYKKYLPVSENTPVVTLLEGQTPLLRAGNLEKELKFNGEIYLKYEGVNPTGSFKDRGMTVAVSKAKEEKTKAIICASTGNTSAAAAAYAAKAGMRCIVLIPEGAVALGKLSQALVHGAQVLAVKENFDVALKLVREISQKYPVTLVNSLNPYRIEGQKTAAFEIIDTLGWAPDYQFMPVGNAGNITAYWKGYKEFISGDFKMSGLPSAGMFIPRAPKMMGFQAEGAAPIVKGQPIENPQTLATAIRIGNPASWKQAVEARDQSGGVIDTVTDDEIISAYKFLASREGVFVEPASAAAVAGLVKYVKNGRLPTGNSQLKIVCILTGHGLKDPDQAIKVSSAPRVVEATLESIGKEIQL